jgi:DNA replication ATP-dependent helicase/nuclease Dna2
MTPEALVAFFEREREALNAEEEERRALSVAELVERGDAIEGLGIVEQQLGVLVLRCTENISRLRTGDRVELHHSDCRVTGTLVELLDHGCELHIELTGKKDDLPTGLWTASALPVDVSSMIIACLERLKPGGPGWAFFRALQGEVAAGGTAEVSGTALAVLGGRGLDRSQEAAFRRCVICPQFAAIQGPPGTGKTRLLALVAEALARLDNRVLVVAPTHQAVNNALSQIRSLFPGRRVVKVGDELRRESLDEHVEARLIARRSGIRVTSETITGMTFLSALVHLVLRQSALGPHVVLVEEAGQLPVTHGACAGLLGAGSVLLFGDDKQMPPVFPGELANEPGAISLFGRLRTEQPEVVSRLMWKMVGRSFRCRSDAAA